MSNSLFYLIHVPGHFSSLRLIISLRHSTECNGTVIISQNPLGLQNNDHKSLTTGCAGYFLTSYIRRRKPITFISNLLANSDIKLKRVQGVHETRFLKV